MRVTRAFRRRKRFRRGFHEGGRGAVGDITFLLSGFIWHRKGRVRSKPIATDGNEQHILLHMLDYDMPAGILAISVCELSINGLLRASA